MKTRLLVLMLILPLLAAAGQDKPAAADFEEFSSKEGGFTVLLPGKPTPQVKKSKGPDGKEMTSHLFVVDQKTTAYLVAYLIDANLAKGGEGVKKALENARKAAEIGLKGKLLDSEKDIELDKHPGVEFQLELPKLRIYRSRVYIVNDRLYQVSVLGPKEVALSKDADQVLASFKLLKPEDRE